MTWERAPGLRSSGGALAFAGALALSLASTLQAQTADVGAASRTRPQAVASGYDADADAEMRRELAVALNDIRQGQHAAGLRRLERLIARYPDHEITEKARATVAELYLRRAGLGADSDRRSGLGAGTAGPGLGRWQVEIERSAPLADAFRAKAGDRVFFAVSSHELGLRGREALRAQARWLQSHPEVTVTIEGHADDPGADADNRMLAGRRAEAVRRRLVEEGVAAARIRVESHGFDRRVALCMEAMCSAQNRRAITRLDESDGVQASAVRATDRGTNGVPR